MHRILTENMDMRKLCARWVSRLLTMEQKQRRKSFSIECLAMFHSNKTDFLRRFITMDEIKKKRSHLAKLLDLFKIFFHLKADTFNKTRVEILVGHQSAPNREKCDLDKIICLAPD